jgi:hypothetical protein
MRATTRIFAAFGIMFSAATLAGAWPATVAGDWVASEKSTGGSLLTLTQGVDANACKRVTGTLKPGNKPVEQVTGSYCPQSGRLVFIRVNAKGAHQAWVGQATGGDGCDAYFSATFSQLAGKTGQLGESAGLIRRAQGCSS